MSTKTAPERGQRWFQGRRPRVLAVEDEEDFRFILGEWLSREFDALLLGDPERLFEEVRAHRPDAIILDLGLPGIDGLKLCRLLHETPETANTPLVVLTAFKEPALYERAMSAGARSYLCKPLGAVELRQRLWQLLDPPEPVS
ncbi:MAG: response regulator [Elusimicrobia bacterium]|nr:response regulator [Elusimicrobiota bacterium]